jgi:uncharacterized membrane protein YdjX (TVP38/TMEM64 family)
MKKLLNEEEKAKLQKKIKLATTIFKFTLLIAIVVGLPLYIWFFHHDLITRFSSISSIKAMADQYKIEGVFIYLAAQIVQIIICIIPGQWIQLGAGFTYGFWIGYFISLLGAFLGAVITFNLAKWLGRDAMHMIFGEEKITKYIEQFNSKRAVIIVFLIYLIPGVPKDLCNYAAGISEMKLKPFLIISLIARSPAMMGSILIGTQLGVGRYTLAIIIFAVAVSLFVLGIIFRKPLMAWFDRVYDKLMDKDD